MSDLRNAISRGHYARKQLFSSDRLVAWSHGRRFETAVAIARSFAGRRILDYGCGDGTFLALTMLQAEAPAIAVGAELHRPLVEDCRRRYREEPRLEFVMVRELDTSAHRGLYDAVFCMEVLEHVVNVDPELERLESLVAPEGKLVISVPVETGLPLLIKQAVRRIAGWRCIGHYPGTSSYTYAELAASLTAGPAQHIPRPVFDSGDGPFHDHKGFNWMAMRDCLRRRFLIERCLASPIAWLGPRLATQVWFIAKARATRAIAREA